MRLSSLAALYERTLRKIPGVVHLLTLLPFYTLCVTCIGLALSPGILIFRFVLHFSVHWGMIERSVALGITAAVAYLAYGLSLILIIPAMNFLLRAKLRHWRGNYYSSASVKWYIHNGLTYIVRFTFLEFITPTPLNVLFFRMMGMRIGRGVQINSSHISDPSLISIGDRATIGGSAVIVGHYGVGGFLVLSPVKIGEGATIGLRAIIMGGTQIGDHAKILPNSVVLPKTSIPAGETWGGVPAQKIETRKAA